MVYPKKNDMVSLFYTGKLDNGEIFQTVKEDRPLVVQIGNSDIPPTLEQTIKEMETGDSRKVRVPPEEGFGPRRKDLVQTIDNEEMVKSVDPKPGMILALEVKKDGEEQKIPATVIKVEDSKITVDYNHPLAGHHLTYDITISAISEESAN
ncbi:MAG: peptidylprolyl isomerase [Deltaproteobacteria bacterium]|nr:peptidylprolyl isomerase [Deltaproteobacteria bacterium]MBW2658946.1 peptidylprolyl isomerase [Deltaproteobacteria bacterium]